MGQRPRAAYDLWVFLQRISIHTYSTTNVGLSRGRTRGPSSSPLSCPSLNQSPSFSSPSYTCIHIPAPAILVPTLPLGVHLLPRPLMPLRLSTRPQMKFFFLSRFCIRPDSAKGCDDDDVPLILASTDLHTCLPRPLGTQRDQVAAH